MEEYLKIFKNPKNEKAYNIDFLSEQYAKKSYNYHAGFPVYRETPLADLKNLAEYVGVQDFFVKDESWRFGLNAFKVLGGSYAIGKYICERLESHEEKLSYQFISSDEVHDRIKDLTFISTTDGNHGRGVAWTVRQLGCRCIIHMPKGSALERLDNIKKEGAYADITEYNYDESVRISRKEAEQNGYVMVQDTAWAGYEDIPMWIIQGYLTMAYEACQQIEAKGKRPTHIFVQAGVGSLATAVTGFFSNIYQDNPPYIAIVESNKADCLYRTAEADDGKLHTVTGDMDTIMAGLACGEPCTIGWPVLSGYADYFISCPEYISAKGMRVLANPIEDDPKIISGESGAVGIGVVTEILNNPMMKHLSNTLEIDGNSVVLCFSTEGDTNKEGYRKVVWDGFHPSC